MPPLPLLALAIQMSLTTKVVAVALLVGAYAGGKYWWANRSAPPAVTAVRPDPPATADPPVAPSPVHPTGMKPWMDNWRPLMECAIQQQDARQIELLNLMMAARTEGALEDADEGESL